MSENITIEKMSLSGVQLSLDWAASEGWNPGLNDAEAFYHCDPDGFFLARIGGEPAGAISAVAYGESFGFIGLFIVRPGLRGHSLGKLLGRAALERLGSRNTGLDGVEKKIHNYSDFGFKLAYGNARYEGVREKISGGFSADSAELSELSFADVEDYDLRFFQAPRTEFLKRWIKPAGGAGLALLKGGRIAASGVIRPCRKGFKIGPLFADSPELAGELFLALLSRIPEREPFWLDIPEPNAAAAALVKKHRMKPVFRTARMYSKEAPALPVDRIFGVTTFELG
jgi:GNAT superfamily N-acetyltransferase